MSENILVINSGSSSIKFSLFDMKKQSERASGLAERLGSTNASLTVKTATTENTIVLTDSDYNSTLKIIIEQLKQLGLLDALPVAIGHRVVHGGESFSDPVLITHHVIKKIRECIPLAPLHNPANLAGIEAIAELYPEMPQVAVFDTAFHQTLPKKAYLYGIPYELYQELGVRRYGFHGTSHQYVATEAAERLQLGETYGLISAHLGNGCSACAIKNGHSVDTTMGMTPLEGLIMGTRSGDIDPGLFEFLNQQKGWNVEKITQVLNKESGMLGLSTLSNDMRTIEQAATENNEQAQIALDVFCFRLARQIGGLAASLDQLDALIFTGGIGENSRYVRASVLNNLKIFGFNLDEQKNSTNGDEHGVITTTTQPAAIVIPTQEEWMIASATYALI